MNQPYVKQFDETGKLKNPIRRHYQSQVLIGRDPETGKPNLVPNRRQRRSRKEEVPAGHFPQHIILKDEYGRYAGVKTIYHHLSVRLNGRIS